MVSAYKQTSGQFDSKTDIVSVGFRQVGTDLIYIGDSKFSTNNIPVSLNGDGVLSINNLSNQYELANISKETMYLKTPFIVDLDTNSYFSNQTVRLVIQYLGDKKADSVS